MKKTRMAWLALVVLVCTMVLPAQAASAPLTISFAGPATLHAGESASIVKTSIAATESGVVKYTLTDLLNKQVIRTETRNVAAGDVVAWPVPYDDTGLTTAKNVKRMKASFEMDGKTYTYSFYFNYSKANNQGQIVAEKETWYSNNTACSFGPQFRELSPALTDKWYMFTPIDLNIQGRQEFEYVASNVYIIGKVFVDVSGDWVTVSYQNNYAAAGGNTETKEEFFTFFSDYASVTQVDPELMAGQGFAFGTPISIENDLGGDTQVLLFVRNKVTYCDYVNSTHKLTRFWINHPDHVALRNQMLAMME